MKEVRNPQMAKVPVIPDEINLHFIYPFVTTQKDKTIEFPTVREGIYRSTTIISGKARHKGFTLTIAITDRAPRNR